MAKQAKKSNDGCCCSGEMGEKISKCVDELKKMAGKAKGKYDKADPKTKKTILSGVAGAVALLAGVAGIKAIKKKIKK